MNKLSDLLRSKRVHITEINKWGNYLRSVWEKQFTAGLSTAEKERIGLDYYLWHIFSFKIVKCFEGEEALNKFNNEVKSNCYVFYQRSDCAAIIENAELLKAEDFNNEDDIYVMDRNFKWTYVRTHEEDLGPYFYKHKT